MLKNRKYVMMHIITVELLSLVMWLALGRYLDLSILEILAIALYSECVGMCMIVSHYLGLIELGIES